MTAAFTYTCVGPSCAWPTAGRATACHRVDAGGGTLLVDLGHGALQVLRERGEDLGALAGVLLTHLHLDHWADLVPLVWARTFELAVREPLTVVVPEGQAERLRDVLRRLDAEQALDGIALRELEAGGAGGGPGSASGKDPAAPGATLRVGRLTATAAALPHSPRMPVNAYRLTHDDGRSLVLGGDCGPNDVLGPFAAGADLLVLEASVPAPLPGHLTPGQAGEVIARAAPGAALLSHYLAPLGGPPQLALARAACPGVPVAFATPGAAVEVGGAGGG